MTPIKIKKMINIASIKEIVLTFGRVISMMTCLYFFVCSLSFLSDSFRILGGRNIGALFSNSDLLQNPVVGLMIGVLVTVLVQSSSTSTSIIVGLVSAGAPVKTAIPMIMGANIGTSVTNIIVALTQAGDREQFRKAFSCANVHDMFNWLTAFTLLIVECLTGYLETVTSKLVENVGYHPAAKENVKSPDFLKALTRPVTDNLIKLDKAVLKGWAQNDPKYDNASTILKTGCGSVEEGQGPSCHFLFAYLGPEGWNIGETYIGVLLLAISLVMLCGCLIGMVKVLNSLLGSKVKNVIENVINADIPVRGLGWLTGYLAMVLGALLTILVQSSSVFTSTLTPLAGAGLISLERAYPLTLGSNLGTTTTSILASFAAGGDNMRAALQIALVHLTFNVTGILLFYPIPWMRWPIAVARALGNVTSQYRWFAVLYLALMFFIFPLTLFGLSMAGPIPLYIAVTLIISTIIFSVVVNNLQTSAPRYLPAFLHNWNFLPLFLHSFEPWDRVIMGAVSCCCRRKGWDDAELKQVIVTNKTPSDSEEKLDKFDNVAYNTLPIARLVSRQRNSNSFSLMMETNYTYNKLPAANKIFSPPSPLIEKLLPATDATAETEREVSREQTRPDTQR